MRPFSFPSLSLSSGHISICVASVRRSPPPESQSSFLQNQRKERPKERSRPSARACASVACLSESAIPYLPRSHPFLGRSLSLFILLFESPVMLIRSRNPIGAVSIAAIAAMHSFPYSTVRPSVRRQFAMWTGGARVYPQIQSVSQPRNLFFGLPLRPQRPPSSLRCQAWLECLINCPVRA